MTILALLQPSYKTNGRNKVKLKVLIKMKLLNI